MSLRREWGLPLGSHSAQAQRLWGLDCDVFTLREAAEHRVTIACPATLNSVVHTTKPNLNSPEREAQTFSLMVTILFSFSAILFYYFGYDLSSLL